jgi:hypothetical protein
MGPPPFRNRPFNLPPVGANNPPSISARPAPGDLSAFLRNLADVDFSPYCELLKAQGFDIPRLQTMATWRRDEIEEALNRLLIGSGAAAVGRPGMTAMVLIKFEIAVRALKPTPPARVRCCFSFPFLRRLLFFFLSSTLRSRPH